MLMSEVTIIMLTFLRCLGGGGGGGGGTAVLTMEHMPI